MQMVEGDDVEMTSTENLFHTVMLTLEMSDGVCLDVAEEREELCRRLVAALLDNAKTPEEVELGEALLEGYDSGELEVLTDVATGETLFTLKEAN